jgi:hypothetical protein
VGGPVPAVNQPVRVVHHPARGGTGARSVARGLFVGGPDGQRQRGGLRGVRPARAEREGPAQPAVLEAATEAGEAPRRAPTGRPCSHPRHRRPAVARSWMLAHTSTGLEGFVAKRLDQPYRPGQRGWQKLRTRITAEAVVGGGNRVTEHPPHEGIVSASSIRTPCSVCARTSGCTGPEGGARRRPGGPRSRSGFAERRNSSPAARTTAGRRTRARVHARRGRRASGGADRSECRDGDRGRARRVPAGATWLRGPDVDGPGRP